MEPTFESILSVPQGTLCALLRDAYSFEPGFERDFLSHWKDFDCFFHDHPAIAESCGFMTVLGRTPIGFVTWNPTHLPEYVEIGHNCIAAFKGAASGAYRCVTPFGASSTAARGASASPPTKFSFPLSTPMKAQAFASSAGAKSRSAPSMPGCAWHIG